MNESLIGIGAYILKRMDYTETVSSLWNKVSENEAVGSYAKYILALDFLFMLGTIEWSNGILRKTSVKIIKCK